MATPILCSAAGADPEGSSGRGDATHVAYLQEEYGRFAYLPGGVPAAPQSFRAGSADIGTMGAITAITWLELLCTTCNRGLGGWGAGAWGAWLLWIESWT